MIFFVACTAHAWDDAWFSTFYFDESKLSSVSQVSKERSGLSTLCKYVNSLNKSVTRVDILKIIADRRPKVTLGLLSELA